MIFPDLTNDRFTTENGLLITIQIPTINIAELKAAILEITDLKYGDYDSVTFETEVGKQSFRSLGSGRNIQTANIVSVPCSEVSFFIENDAELTRNVLTAIYNIHPYEEPVILVTPTLRTLHIRGKDENNPNRFWNKKTAEWVPKEHR